MAAGKNAIAFIAGLGTGYLSAQEKERQKAREAKKDTQDDEIHDARMTEIRDKQKEKAALAEAGKTVAVNENAATLDTSGKPVLYEDAGVANSDFRQARSMADVTGAPIPGTAPQQTFAAGGVPFDTKDAAQAAADTANTPTARATRTAAALYGAGKPVEAMQLEAGAKTAQAADMQLAQAKWNRDLGMAMQGGHDGLAKLVTDTQADGLKDHKFQAVKNADGTVTYAKVGEKGVLTPVPALTFPDSPDGVTMAGYALDRYVTPAQRLDHALKSKKEEREGKLTDAHAKYYDKAGDALVTRADAAEAKTPAEKMSEIDKVALTSINKQADTINTAITKAQAEGTWDDKSPGAQQLKTQLAALNLKKTQIATKYAGDAGPAGQADPLGMRKPVGAGYSSEGQMKVAATGGMGADPQALAREIAATKAQMAGAKDPASKQLLQDHVAELERQAAAYKVKPAAPSMAAGGVAPAAPAAAAPAAVAPPAAPAAPKQNALPPAAEAAGQALDAARDALSQLAAKPRPGMAAGKEAREAYANEVAAAKALVKQREAEYQKQLPALGAAFVRQV